ncbi:MAG: 50S ribosomal protein L30 [Candidatus Nanoarchaeia archaeon]
MNRIAVIRVRGRVHLRKEIEDTLKLMRLYRKNTCVIIKDSEPMIGMLQKVKDYVTWGEIDEETFKLLLDKRGRLAGNVKLTEEYLKEKLKTDYDTFSKDYFAFKKELKDIPGMKQFFKLCPPVHGFERKGIKKPFSLGGALGYRKEKINELIKRMV